MVTRPALPVQVSQQVTLKGKFLVGNCEYVGDRWRGTGLKEGRPSPPATAAVRTGISAA
ncbi:hypothetical protein M406DRAFT_320895 [Cryphonectria parasitica EP155]|uniref:Uncharacterized protein n=1 Tax=Cryphonectria parasitica (strain ATCC 38755 / EP155) TaxID=660469 RepID=A0A9P4Y7V8_CRYP1|nr:uncharacterized protein M406DRAFT_320895 [Cryphonectria parasitica EP155]KAF3768547.1 hypothetical protein M406DRAFT_320895 [Cryphonectria parasitica EP155]